MTIPASSQATNAFASAKEKDPELPEYREEPYTPVSSTSIGLPPTRSTGDSPDQVLWPGNTFVVLERGSGLAMTIGPNGRLSLTETAENKANADQSWLCVEKDGYFGLYNTKAMVYVGHDNRDSVHASARALQDHEFVLPRRHPNGGYQLLSPRGKTMKMIVIADESQRIMRADHGVTLWEFRKVQTAGIR